MTAAKPATALRSDARRNRVRVLQAAEEAFAAEGVAVPLDEIARRAGVGAGTVYRHFPSKEALFEAVVLERIQQLTLEARAVAGAADPGAAFYEFFGRVVEQASLNKALCDAFEASTGLGFRASADAERDFALALGELLTRAQRAGAVRADLEVADVRALMVGYLALERHSPEGKRLGGVLLDGLRAGPSVPPVPLVPAAPSGFGQFVDGR